jgi:uncharacterized protein (DUF1778 family)
MPGTSVAPVSFRMPDRDLAVIDRAARLKGRSRTEFVREAAVREAEQAVLDATVVRLSPDEFAALEAHLKAPGDPPQVLRELLHRTDSWDSAGPA